MTAPFKTATPHSASSVFSLDELKAAARGEAGAVARVAAALRADEAARFADIQHVPATQIAGLLLRLPPRDARKLLGLLPDRPNLAVLDVLDPAISARLLDAKELARLGRLVAGLDPAAAADLLAGLPAALTDRVLAGHAQAGEIRAALAYGEETAGGAMMRRQLVATPRDWSVEQVIAEIRAHSDDIERISAVYVVDEQKRLIGFLKLRDLLLQPGDAKVGDIMRGEVAAVGAGSDREEALRIADRERIPVVPVVDDSGRLVGLIPAEELREIERDEAAEDLKFLSGAPPESDPSDSPVEILRHRFPWLASALVGALGAGLIVGSFEEALEEAVILASLIPMVMDMAGNAGIQTSTVTIEAMAGDNFWRGDLKARFLRELGGALLNGSAVGLLTGLGILLLSLVVEIEQPLWLAATALVTLILIIVQAAVVGVLVPLGLKKLKFDPAVGTGVFITTVNDFAGITLLFLVAKTLYLPHL